MLEQIKDAVGQGNMYGIGELLEQSMQQGTTPNQALKAMLAGLEDCGERFGRGEYFLPELIAAAEAFKVGMKVLEPRMKEVTRVYAGTVVLGTVSGDVHDIGKKLVGFMLESAGFQVIDLGVDVSPQQFADAARRHRPHCLGMSALLTTTMLGMEEVIAQLQAAGLRDQVKVIIGGAPVSLRYAERVGADGYASDAPSAVEKVRALTA